MELIKRLSLLPPRIPHRKLQGIRDEIGRHVATRNLMGVELYRLEGDGLAQAKEDDARSFAAAHRKGKPDPGPKAQAKVEKEIETKQRQLAGVERAVGDTYSELTQAVEQHGDAIGRKIAGTISDERKAITAALDSIDTAFAALTEALALGRWVDEGVYQKRPASSVRLRGVLGANGEPINAAMALGALRELVESWAEPDEAESTESVEAVAA